MRVDMEECEVSTMLGLFIQKQEIDLIDQLIEIKCYFLVPAQDCPEEVACQMLHSSTPFFSNSGSGEKRRWVGRQIAIHQSVPRWPHWWAGQAYYWRYLKRGRFYENMSPLNFCLNFWEGVFISCCCFFKTITNEFLCFQSTLCKELKDTSSGK